MEELIKIDENIKNKIYVIRGKQVMLDRDLSDLFQTETRVFMQSIKRNIERFPESFMFQLTKEEFINWKSQIVMSENDRKGLRRPPYAFTEQGVAMLTSILKSNIAIQISISIIDAFVEMRHYLYDNQDIYRTLNYINNKMNEHDEKLDELFSHFNRREKLFLDGTVYDSHSYVHSILKDVKEEVIIIDPYADLEMLDMIKDIDANIGLIMKNRSLLSEKQINKFNKQYNDKLKVFKNDKFHDRYIILDRNIVYHLGTSINHLGKRVFSITLLEDKIVKGSLLKCINNIVVC